MIIKKPFLSLMRNRSNQRNVAAPFTVSELSLIIPVKDNPEGVDRLLCSCLTAFSAEDWPRDILLIDNRSKPPLAIDPCYEQQGMPVRVITCSTPGPAAARNSGVQAAHGTWVLFLDSDCLLTPTFIEGYRQAIDGAVAYAGMVHASGKDIFSAYYDSQQILVPRPVRDESGIECPATLVTANTLVWKAAFVDAGGFDERFSLAAGEDFDLGLRLLQIGSLSYAPKAIVIHSFEPGIIAFLKRFIRYGRGNRLLATIHQINLRPRRIAPLHPSALNQVLAFLQYLALRWGYDTARLPEDLRSASPSRLERQGE